MLELKDYFTPNNGYLTRSRIKDFFICPSYFHRKHILGEIKDKSKDAYKTGSGVDDVLAQIENKNRYIVMDCDFRVKANREAKIDAELAGNIVLKQEEYDNIMSLAISVEQTDAYRQLESHKRQQLLQMEYEFPNKLFHGLAALPDFLRIDGDTAILTDLKTASQFKLSKWHYHCLDYGYYDQFALQTIILQHQGIKNFTYRHLVVNKLDNVWDVHAIVIPHELVKVNELLFKIDIIANTTDFSKYNPTWDEPEVLESEDWNI